MLTLYLSAPFAVFRSFTAGWYRPTSLFLTPSAAYGLLLNLARIEMRLPEESPDHPGDVPTTLIRPGLPAVHLALGIPTMELRGQTWVELEAEDLWPRSQSLLQQLHNYPVGTSGQEREAEAKGNKYNITPVRREFLSNFRCVLCVEGGPEFESSILEGLSGRLNEGRYGLPFFGDNSFLPDRIESLEAPPKTFWIKPQEGEQDRSTLVSRGTLWIDRGNMAKTKQVLLTHERVASTEPSSQAWFSLPQT